MTHGQAMQLRCGGLRGLADQAGGIAPGESVADVFSLVDRLADASGDFDGVAWERVVREITAWQSPVRRNRK